MVLKGVPPNQIGTIEFPINSPPNQIGTIEFPINNRKVITLFDQGNASIRSECWRLVRYADYSVELYDLQNSPHEWTNLPNVNQRESVNAHLVNHPPKK